MSSARSCRSSPGWSDDQSAPVILGFRRGCRAPAAVRNRDAVVVGRTGADPAARGPSARPVLPPRRRNRDPAAERRRAPAPSLAPWRNRAMTGGLAVALFGLTAIALTMLLA